MKFKPSSGSRIVERAPADVKKQTAAFREIIYV